MKVGSLVIAIEDFYNEKMWFIAKDTILEIRTLESGRYVCNNSPGTGIRFVGIINGLCDEGSEFAYCSKYFKEVQPPMEINIEELLNNSNIGVI